MIHSNIQMKLIFRLILIFIACFLLSGKVFVSNTLFISERICIEEKEIDFDVKSYYDKAEYMIPMRDGVRLFTIVYTPKDISQKYPILLSRTPYSVRWYGLDNYHPRLGPSVDFDQDKYIFVFQDVRGKFKSEGEFVVDLPYIPNKKEINEVDESSDTFDTIEWLLKNIPNHNGCVGQWGISYGGWETTMGMIDAHPALKASSPQASPSDQFIGDDVHHNGAFKLMYNFSWASRTGRTRSGPTEKRSKRFDFKTPWGYKFFMEIGPLSRINELYFDNRIPIWNEWMEHGTYDEYWQKINILPHLKNIKHAVLNVAGWFDAEDFYGPMSIYYTIEKENPKNKSTLVAGPWRHGGWRSMEGNHLGCIDFGSKTSLYFQRKIQFPFFSYYLKHKGDWDVPEAIVFETGTNVWKTYDQWPPKGVVPTKLYFHSAGKVSFVPPKEDTANKFDSYVSDPDKPVPYSAEIRNTSGSLWMVEDQRFAATRPDLLVFQTDILTEDVTIAGPIISCLYVSTTGTDSDWIVKLIDVYPSDSPDSDYCNEKMGDFQMLLAGEIFRSKFRNSFTLPEPMIPDKVTKIKFDLGDRYHTFLKGHRIMVQVQSSWFPQYDRNPQKFVDIYHAKASDFQKATQRIYRSPEYPSHLILRVLKQNK